MRRNRRNASVTVPLCLLLTIFALFLFSLAESARFYGLKEDAKEWARLTTESLFASYQPMLFQQYQMFLLDGSFHTGELDMEMAEAEMEALLNESLMAGGKKEGMNLYRMQAAGVQVTAYRLITDEEGKVFEVQAAKAMKSVIGTTVAESLLNRINDMGQKEMQGGDPEKSIQQADAALEELEKQKEAEKKEQEGKEQESEAKTEEPVKTEELKENPLKVMKTLRQQGILALVLPSGTSPSGKNISLNNCLLNRSWKEGTYKQEENPGLYERVLTQEFIKSFAGNAVAPIEKNALAYGMEYVINGSGSDIENLKSIVARLLILRETVNFLYLQTDGTKREESLAVATLIAGATANPVIVTAVQQGILAAWAYVESLCDVKTLLSGGRVPLVKSEASWKSQLSQLSQAVKADYSKDDSGYSYEDYLDYLMYGKSVKQIAYRSMDLMEWNLQNEKDYAKCRMNQMIVGIKAEVELDADTLFLGIFGKDPVMGYHFTGKTDFVYD